MKGLSYGFVGGYTVVAMLNPICLKAIKEKRNAD